MRFCGICDENIKKAITSSQLLDGEELNLLWKISWGVKLCTDNKINVFFDVSFVLLQKFIRILNYADNSLSAAS